ncbi:phage tail protein [Leminorella grimontii]|uniref:phage tail protein n=1 Tax=Leminorella grimontii TaxID=82981 RepID=UPI00208867AA|nr:phage tail protein [Leminorella grimontii]GKX58341.1 tail protein [Leminorella grimontii]
MEVFNWIPAPGMTVNTEPSVAVVKLGDGYEQRQKKGINNMLRKYPVTFRLRRNEAWLLDDFLARHGGVDAFLWTPPFRYKQGRFVCRKWSSVVQSTVTEFSCEFEEVMM